MSMGVKSVSNSSFSSFFPKTVAIGSLRINTIVAVALAALLCLAVYYAVKRCFTSQQAFAAPRPAENRPLPPSPPSPEPVNASPAAAPKPQPAVAAPAAASTAPEQPVVPPGGQEEPQPSKEPEGAAGLPAAAAVVASPAAPAAAQQKTQAEVNAYLKKAIQTLNTGSLKELSTLDNEMKEFEISSNPLHFLTELPNLYRKDPDSRGNIDAILAPWAPFQEDPKAWKLTNIANSVKHSAYETLRMTKQDIVLAGFLRRAKELYSPEGTLCREAVIKELSLDGGFVNGARDTILQVKTAQHSFLPIQVIVTPEDKQIVLDFFRYFLSGKKLETVTAAAPAASAAAADHKS